MLGISLMLREWLRISLSITTISPMDITIGRIISTVTALTISSVTISTKSKETSIWT